MKKTNKLLEQILDQQHIINESLQVIVELMTYFASEQEADLDAAQQIRFIGDGIDEEDNTTANDHHDDNGMRE